MIDEEKTEGERELEREEEDMHVDCMVKQTRGMCCCFVARMGTVCLSDIVYSGSYAYVCLWECWM